MSLPFRSSIADRRLALPTIPDNYRTVIIGVDVFFVMQCLGEMATLYPSAGAFTELSGRFIDGSIAVSLGWNYWYLVRL